MNDCNSFPSPLTPIDCNLRGLPLMPLDTDRLLDSDMMALSTGGVQDRPAPVVQELESGARRVVAG